MTANAAYTNWKQCFDEGRYTAARGWWVIYWKLAQVGRVAGRAE